VGKAAHWVSETSKIVVIEQNILMSISQTHQNLSIMSIESRDRMQQVTQAQRNKRDMLHINILAYPALMHSNPRVLMVSANVRRKSGKEGKVTE
jgi:hypothetical protein